jgi:hypothetical protein
MNRTVGRVGVVLAMSALLVAGCGPDGDGTASPPAGNLLRPGAEVDGTRLTTADETDTTIFDITCDPIRLEPGIHESHCRVPQLPRLMVGFGNIAASPELLEQEWRAQRWQLYLDGHEVDLAAFGTLADRPYVAGTWIRLWAVTLVSPTPGQHTLRYVRAHTAVGTQPADTIDVTWTLTVEVLRRRP